MERRRNSAHGFQLRWVAACCLVLAACAGTVVHEVRSDYSRIRVIDSGSQRSLVFLGDSGIDVVESQIDLRAPHVLQHAYAQTAMAVLLYRAEASTCLLIGLGGGAMVRFLNHHFPQLRLDVVEIDPAVVRVAREYFGTAESPATRIHVADGREFAGRSGSRYDLVLIDAHLHPDDGTDRSGHPLSLRSEAFYGSVRARLNPGGAAMFNILKGPDSDAHIEGIRRAFGALDEYRPAATGNLIVIAAAGGLASEGELRARARALDRSGGYGFSFEQLLAVRAGRTASGISSP